jgi:hypothetical protein
MLHVSKLLTTSTFVITIFESNNFTKTLLFCANFLRKMTAIKISDHLCVLLFYVHYFRHI